MPGYPDIGHNNIRTLVQNGMIGVYSVGTGADKPDIIFFPINNIGN